MELILFQELILKLEGGLSLQNQDDILNKANIFIVNLAS